MGCFINEEKSFETENNLTNNTGAYDYKGFTTQSLSLI